ncbi:MAG: type III pantothenate kinase [Planctomycetes bacterium]|nr:type III pantothenate kinase [Planctomycetota bacterium]
MILRPPPFDPDAPVVVIDIGNTSTHLATWVDARVKTPLAVPQEDQGAFEARLLAHVQALPAGRSPAVVIGSVAPQVLERVRTYLLAALSLEALVVGEAIPLPMDVDVEDRRAIGVDRVCAAAAAYERLQTACTVVDFGTAVTVDLVDDAGTLLGGAILPGLLLQLRSLHEHTAQLPLATPGIPELPYGRNTLDAMRVGVCRGLAGAVRGIVEGYATSLKRWPQVVATGGDLSFLAPHCDFLDTLVQDLTLSGIGLAYNKYLAAHGV